MERKTSSAKNTELEKFSGIECYRCREEIGKFGLRAFGQSVYEGDFADTRLRLLKLVRASMVYLSLSVRHKEQARQKNPGQRKSRIYSAQPLGRSVGNNNQPNAARRLNYQNSLVRNLRHGCRRTLCVRDRSRKVSFNPAARLPESGGDRPEIHHGARRRLDLIVV